MSAVPAAAAPAPPPSSTGTGAGASALGGGPRPALTRQRCTVHPAREAAVRCPRCARFFCRECITEHAGHFLCTSCLRATAAAAARRPGGWLARGWAAGVHGLLLAAALALLWFVFYQVGQALARIPPEVHEGTVWRPAPADPD